MALVLALVNVCAGKLVRLDPFQTIASPALDVGGSVVASFGSQVDTAHSRTDFTFAERGTLHFYRPYSDKDDVLEYVSSVMVVSEAESDLENDLDVLAGVSLAPTASLVSAATKESAVHVFLPNTNLTFDRVLTVSATAGAVFGSNVLLAGEVQRGCTARSADFANWGQSRVLATSVANAVYVDAEGDAVVCASLSEVTIHSVGMQTYLRRFYMAAPVGEQFVDVSLNLPYIVLATQHTLTIAAWSEGISQWRIERNLTVLENVSSVAVSRHGDIVYGSRDADAAFFLLYNDTSDVYSMDFKTDGPLSGMGSAVALTEQVIVVGADKMAARGIPGVGAVLIYCRPDRECIDATALDTQRTVAYVVIGILSTMAMCCGAIACVVAAKRQKRSLKIAAMARNRGVIHGLGSNDISMHTYQTGSTGAGSGTSGHATSPVEPTYDSVAPYSTEDGGSTNRQALAQGESTASSYSSITSALHEDTAAELHVSRRREGQRRLTRKTSKKSVSEYGQVPSTTTSTSVGYEHVPPEGYTPIGQSGISASASTVSLAASGTPGYGSATPDSYFSELSDTGVVAAAAMPPIPIEEITFRRQIGVGAFGEVHLAEWHRMQVVVKQFRAAGTPTADDEARRQLRIEGLRLGALRPHNNVITFLGLVYKPLSIVLQYCSGGSLYDALYGSNIRPFTPAQLKEICMGVAKGMWHLHSERVVHRDLAARNVLLDGVIAKVTDFGLSRFSLTGEDRYNNKTESAVGPVYWMAPEALRDRKVHVKCDVYSFGVVLYEMYAREQPWQGMSTLDAAMRVLQGERLPIPAAAPVVVERVMLAAWETDPRIRPGMSDVLDMFDAGDWEVPQPDVNLTGAPRYQPTGSPAAGVQHDTLNWLVSGTGGAAALGAAEYEVDMLGGGTSSTMLGGGATKESLGATATGTTSMSHQSRVPSAARTADMSMDQEDEA